MRHFHSLTVKQVRRETDDCVSVTFDVAADLKEQFAFIQGQYLTLRTTINGEDIRRSYSICSGVDEELRVAIKEVEGGKFSTWANRSLKAGDQLEVMPPMGRFFVELKPDEVRHHVAFAAGSGITPVLSLAKTTLAKEPNSTFTLFYVNKTSTSIIFKEELENLKDRYMSRFRLFHILTREPGDLEMLSGRLDKDRCRQVCSTFVDVSEADAFFVCGPEAMIHAVKDTLTEMGVDAAKVHFELFTTAAATAEKTVDSSTPRTEKSGKNARVEVVLDGNRMEFDLPYD